MNLLPSNMDFVKKERYLENGIDYTPRPLKAPINVTDRSDVSLAGGDASQLSFNLSVSSSMAPIPPLQHTSIKSLFKLTSVDSSSSEELCKLDGENFAPERRDLLKIQDPEEVTVTLTVTEFAILFDMPSKTADLNTPEGLEVQKSNERYVFITGPDNLRKLADSETQTRTIHTKNEETSFRRKKRIDRSTHVNNWIFYDEYENKNELNLKESLPKNSEIENQFSRLCSNFKFRKAARTVLRNLATNAYLNAHKLFLGLEIEDTKSPNFEFSYSLEFLWKHSVSSLNDRIILAFAWNSVDKTILAIGYGPRHEIGDFESEGAVLVWSMKNPQDPERYFTLENPVSSLAWSLSNPHWLAVGLYNGIIQVLDVRAETTMIIMQSLRTSLPSHEPFWCIQWWHDNDQEKLFVCNQDGRVSRFDIGENFKNDEIMRVSRAEENVPGVKRFFVNDFKRDILIAKNPGALVLCKHPKNARIYFVGSNEGCVYRCSMDFFLDHKDSFFAHDGPIYGMEFSPYCPEIFITCGADSYTRIWLDGTTTPLLAFSTGMACVDSVSWCHANSTVFATLCNDRICLWDIEEKTHVPISVTDLSALKRIRKMSFTQNGKQIVVSNDLGHVFVYHLKGIFSPPSSERRQALVSALEKALIGKDTLEIFQREIGR